MCVCVSQCTCLPSITQPGKLQDVTGSNPAQGSSGFSHWLLWVYALALNYYSCIIIITIREVEYMYLHIHVYCMMLTQPFYT